MAAVAQAGAGRTPAAVIAGAAAAGRSVLLEHEVYALVAAAGIGVPRHVFLATPEAIQPGPAAAVTARLHESIDARTSAALGSDEAVVKVASPDLLHKSDVAGVRFCRNEPAALREAAAEVLRAVRGAAPEARLEGVLLAERVRYRAGLGLELLAAIRHDPAFGPVVVIGVGGLDSEALMGALRPEPARAMFAASGLDGEAVRRGLAGTLVARALGGRLRSSEGLAVGESAAVELVLALARLAVDWAGFAPPEGLGLAELELNPVVVAADGRGSAGAADAIESAGRNDGLAGGTDRSTASRIRSGAGRLIALDGLARTHRPEPLPPPRPIDQLGRLLTPRSAVVVGASAEGENPGRVILRNLVAGGGIPRERIWAIHPRATEIEGCRAYASLEALPEPADLAVVSVAADRAEQAVGRIVAGRRARAITLIAGGFGETEAGRGAEARIRALLAESHRASDGGVLLNGGNCLGIISEPGRYNTFFIPPHKLPQRGAPGRGLASVSQSGAYLVSQISNLAGVIAPRYAISFGNQMDVTVADYLGYLERDPEVGVLAVYLEGFQRGDGAAFLEAVRRITAGGRRVLLYKAGRTREGSAAASSHTASAVGDYEVCEELARAAGAVVAASLDAFEDDVVTFTLLHGRSARGRRVAVLSNAGFEATAAADTLDGLELARLGAATRERLAALLPPGIVDVHNPVDATPVTPTRSYAAIARALVEDEGVDALVVAGVPATPFLDTLPKGEGHGDDVRGPDGLATLLADVFRETQKPVVFSVDSGALYDPLAAALRSAGLPTFRRVDRATRALARFVGASRSLLR